MKESRYTNNWLAFDFNEIDEDNYSYITDTIVKNYKLTKSSQLIGGFEEIFQDFKIDKKVIGLEWDIWSGYTVVAKNTDSEVFARNIANFIRTIPKKKSNKKKRLN